MSQTGLKWTDILKRRQSDPQGWGWKESWNCMSCQWSCLRSFSIPVDPFLDLYGSTEVRSRTSFLTQLLTTHIHTYKDAQRHLAQIKRAFCVSSFIVLATRIKLRSLFSEFQTISQQGQHLCLGYKLFNILWLYPIPLNVWSMSQSLIGNKCIAVTAWTPSAVEENLRFI